MTRANQLKGAEWLKNSFSIWRGLGRDTGTNGHPAAFPVSLASRLIDCYASNPKGVVLDPFAGSGSTLLAALHAGMTAVGMDINPAYREMFKRRLSLFDYDKSRWRYETQDSCTMSRSVTSCSVEICITSPPYWDILSRRRSADGKVAKPYSTNGHDLGNIGDYNDFLSALGLVSSQVHAALRFGCYFILNVMDIRKGSQFYPLHMDAIKTVRDHAGLTLEDIVIWDRQADYNSMRPLGYPYKFIVNKVHEYLLVFRKREDNHGKKSNTFR